MASSRNSLRSLAQAPRRFYSGAPTPAAKLNLPIDYKTTPILHHTAASLSSTSEYPAGATSKRLNLYQAINSAMRTALSKSDRTIVFGEDVGFGGVFRCSMDLQTEFGSDRVFNTPLTEQGIAGFAIGAAAEGMKPIAEIQFADYVFPAFDQIVNEAAKFRYREGGSGINVGGLVIRMPCGAVGHGALYHSQSPESLFAHIPGLRVVMPRSPAQAKGLLLSSIFEHNDPVLFMEPKILYRAAVEYVPNEYYTIPLSKAEVIKPGKDLTIISYGQPLYLCSSAISAIEKTMPGVNVELIDLRTIYPWDRQTVINSVKKTGRAIVVHESMVNYGVGAEVASTIQESAFLRLEAPVKRVAGWSTHTGLSYEQFILPDVARIYDAIKQTLEY
ncbi:Transketolase C-terminal/Pyruvate-ferredoxin oxidoreductase domain II [Penicillium robsamsonii]|uniref:Transketolase C-terminal/Pyruvate-ferredoxin oxidoreductase domain II n=1 Tax=Penicillium robsamsonii TaxID=1792511 RepID=UPI002549335B|nr:Transketolase C-terminal/Pyruvate-ferredoxin oxidoreductase domain II [Penicillium robsamsonii]KAJ5835567.1 Transketolase C-terminal/Pyruvate-ferredoxin oxidoreductase domain II [Penicillium robsamsonii]